MSGPAVVTEGIARRFDDYWAVDGVDLSIEEGEIYGFLGPNGAGKSTLVRMLCTLMLPTRGRALVGGEDVARHPERVRLHIGVALQDASLDDKQTGRELLDLQARLYGLDRRERASRIEDVLRLVDIGDAIDRLIGTYSGGMKRRLDLAAALIHDPEILFLDEPTTGLDPLSRVAVWDEVRNLNAELGTTIFLTTQYLEEADELAGRVGIIAKGKMVAEGTPTELKREVGEDLVVAKLSGASEDLAAAVRSVPGVDDVFLERDGLVVTSRDGAAIMSPVAVALHGSGAKVESLTLRTPTLDDVFVQLTGSHLDDEESASGLRSPGSPSSVVARARTGGREEAADPRQAEARERDGEEGRDPDLVRSETSK
ncbi:MAG TPA: ATP-binding cassette domain-containing protein [Acidimicrobiales bacterium]|nr:ATP-binding cassette domain-containing protein [Acidimicrobiales bacterium]